MGSRVTISPATVAVQPGGEAACEVQVRNTGRVVDQFSFHGLGDAAPWVTFEPSSVSLFPDAEGMARLVIRPPRSAETPAGPCAVGVRVVSSEDPGGAVVEELTVEIGELHDTFAELIPRTSRGRRRGVHHLAVDNRGNARLNATLTATDPDDRLRFRFDPPTVWAEPGTAAFSQMRVKPLRRFFGGPDLTHPFRVVVEAEGQPPLSVDGTLLQQALIPRWAPRALAGVLAALIGLGILWAAFLKPTIESAAAEAVEEPLQQQQAQISQQGGRIGDLEQATTGTTTPETTVATVSALGNPYGQRLAAQPKSRDASDSQGFTIPEGQTFSLTDILLQNPAGDAGMLEIRRDEDVIVQVSLTNFRDLDYHFVSPIVFGSQEQAVLFVRCANPEGGSGCSPSAYFTGFIKPA